MESQSPRPSNIINHLIGNKYRLVFLLIILIFLFGIIMYISPSNEQTGITPPANNTAVDNGPPPVNNVVVDTAPPEPVPGQVLVKFKEGIPDTVINEHLKPLNAKILKKIEGINNTVLEVPNGQEEYVQKNLSQDSIVQYAERNYYVHAFYSPNDTDLNKQWGLLNTGQTVNNPLTNQNQVGTANNDIHAEKAWDVTKGSGIKVAVIDTGIDMTHPDLAGKIILTKVFITSSIDDVFGHGTHVAGIIAANTNNSQGISGVCPDCQLLIAKALNDSGTGDMATIAQGVTWAADNGAKVINSSEGGSAATQSLADAVVYAQNKGIVVVGAAGNNGNTAKFYPAAYSKVISVAASDNKDQKSSFSTYGSWVQIAAPGMGIYSTLPHLHDSNLKSEYPNLQRTYDYVSGTSMAAPFVSGVAALVFTTSYGTSADTVIQRLCSTADKISGTGSSWVCGRVNAEAAVGTVTGVSPSPSAQPSPSQPANQNPTSVQPTFVCGGSSIGTNCPPTVGASPGNASIPSVTMAQPSTLPGTNNPSSGLVPSGLSGGNTNPGGNIPQNGNNGNFIQMILDLLRRLIDFLIQLFSGFGGRGGGRSR